MNNILIDIIQQIGFGLDVFGVLIMLTGFILASYVGLRRLLRRKDTDPEGHDLYKSYRQSLARSILIGLEFLVAGDIIRTVGGDLTLNGVLTLGGIVLIRIILGATLEAEINPSKKSFWSRFRK